MHSRREQNRKYRHEGPSRIDLDEIERGEGTLALAVAEPLDRVCTELELCLDPIAIDTEGAALHRLIGQPAPRTEEDRVALETIAGANQPRFIN